MNLIDFHEFIYFYVMQALVRKAAEVPEDKREHLPNYLNQRLVTNGKSRNGMKGRKLLSTLNDDFTVELQDGVLKPLWTRLGAGAPRTSCSRRSDIRGAHHPWTDRGDD